MGMSCFKEISEKNHFFVSFFFHETTIEAEATIMEGK